MKYIFVYLLFLSQTFAQNNFLIISSDSVPPFKIGNKWLFNVGEYNNGVTINYKMTKEIVDTILDNRFVINTKKYFENNIIDSVEYWIWQDSSYSQSQYVNGVGPVLYKIGQENYYISQGPNTWQYTNIIDTIFNIISEGAIYNYSFHINLYSSSWITKVALKVGLYKYSSFESGEGNYRYSNESLIGVRINNIVYGDTTYLITDIVESIYFASNFELFQNYPNPFNPITTISFVIPKESKVTLDIHNIVGERVAKLLDSVLPIGFHKVTFDGSKLTSGVYFYTIRAGEIVSTKKFVLIK